MTTQQDYLVAADSTRKGQQIETIQQIETVREVGYSRQSGLFAAKWATHEKGTKLPPIFFLICVKMRRLLPREMSSHEKGREKPSPVLFKFSPIISSTKIDNKLANYYYYY